MYSACVMITLDDLLDIGPPETVLTAEVLVTDSDELFKVAPCKAEAIE